MSIALRNIVIAVVAASALAACQTAPTACDKPGTKITYNGKCCGVGDAPCREGKNGDKHTPPDRTPTPQ